RSKSRTVLISSLAYLPRSSHGAQFTTSSWLKIPISLSPTTNMAWVSEFPGCLEPLARARLEKALLLLSGHNGIQSPSVMDFVFGGGPFWTRRPLSDRHCFSVERGELAQNPAPAFVGVHHRSNITSRQSVLRQLFCQCHTIEFSDHRVKDTP